MKKHKDNSMHNSTEQNKYFGNYEKSASSKTSHSGKCQCHCGNCDGKKSCACKCNNCNCNGMPKGHCCD
ncbi:MAG TPA: hypothetical protein VKU36_02315 [Candidatus Babeliales bacterium]|nr:hypothetical protein [Candidatus Babeliales bacterium]